MRLASQNGEIDVPYEIALLSRTGNIIRAYIPMVGEKGTVMAYYSTEEKRYHDNFEKQLPISRRLGFAGGAWKWTGFVPHNAYSILAGRASMKSCKEFGIDSYTVTCWGDDGAEASCFSVLPTFFKDALVAYESQMNDRSFEKLTGYKFSEFMKIDLVNPYLEDGRIHNNCSK